MTKYEPARLVVREDADWSTWTVEFGYYGVHADDHSCHSVAWTVEFAGDEQTARRIGRNRELINAALIAERGPNVHARLQISFTDDGMMTIEEYDFSAWTLRPIPARP